MIFVAVMKIKDGSGGPARIFATLPLKDTSSGNTVASCTLSTVNRIVQDATVFPELVSFNGNVANIRAGPPLPSFIFITATNIMLPEFGIKSKFATFSAPENNYNVHAVLLTNLLFFSCNKKMVTCIFKFCYVLTAILDFRSTQNI
jgi:hypothetical protein